MNETLANGYSSKSTQRELSNEYQHDRVWMFFKNIYILVLWTKVASALEGLKGRLNCECVNPFPLRVAKRGLTILEIFSLQKHFF